MTADQIASAVLTDPETGEAIERLVYLLETPETLVKENEAWNGFLDRMQGLISKQKRLLTKREREAEYTSEGIPEDQL
jgi:hypothetical protein